MEDVQRMKEKYGSYGGKLSRWSVSGEYKLLEWKEVEKEWYVVVGKQASTKYGKTRGMNNDESEQCNVGRKLKLMDGQEI